VLELREVLALTPLRGSSEGAHHGFYFSAYLASFYCPGQRGRLALRGCSGGTLIIANGDGLWAVNPNAADPASTARKLALTLDGAPATLCGPDGLQAVPGSSTELIVVENGGCNPTGDSDRVVRIQLSL
jgi:hypothetical protein